MTIFGAGVVEPESNRNPDAFQYPLQSNFNKKGEKEDRMRVLLIVSIVLSLVCLVAVPAHAQNPRPSTQIDVGLTLESNAPAVASDGDLSAIVFNNEGLNGVYVSVSDGRGITWSTPLRIDSDVTAAAKYTQNDSVAVVGNNVFACWEDERNGVSNEDLFFNVSTDGGSTWAGEVLINKAYPAGVGAVRDWRMVATPASTGSPIYVHILISVDPTAASPNEELYLVNSTDGGATFNAPVAVPQGILPGAADVDFIDLAASGPHLTVIWQDNRISGSGSFDDVWINHSHTAGTSWVHPTDFRVNNGVVGGTTDADGDVSVAMIGPPTGFTVIVGWQEERTGLTSEEVRVNISNDHTATWLPADVLIGGYVAGVDDVDAAEVLVNDDGTLVVAWDDNRTGADEIYVASSTDGGVTWVEFSLSTTGGGFPRFAGGGDAGGPIVALAWSNGTFPNVAESAYSLDKGATWSSSLVVSDNTGDVDFTEITYNLLYDNLICAWLSDDLGQNNVYAGGYRPQTVIPVGVFSVGNPVHFDLNNYSKNEPFFGVLISGGTDSFTLPFGDNRETGLQNDNILSLSLNRIPGLLSSSITGGAGSTSNFPFPGSLPPGTVLHCVGVGFNLGTTPPTLGQITDIVTVTVL